MTTLSRTNGDPWNKEQYSSVNTSINIAGTAATTDLTGETGFGSIFSNLPNARGHYLKVSVDANTLYMRLNGTTNDIIQVTATTPFTAEYNEIHSIYVSTGGSAITVNLYMS